MKKIIILIAVVFVYSVLLTFCNQKNGEQDVSNILDKNLQFRIDTLLPDDTLFITEAIYEHLFQQLEQVFIDTSMDLIRFGEQDFFVSRDHNYYFLENANPDLDPDLEQVFYFIIIKRIVYDPFYGEMGVLEIIKKEENY